MASASVTALLWRPLPLRQPSDCYNARVQNFAGSICSLRPSPTSCCSVKPLGNLSLEDSLRSPFLDFRLKFSRSNSEQRRTRRKRGWGLTTSAGMRFGPGGGKNNNDDGGITRVVVNLALAGGLTYLTVTGKLGWVFDAIVSLWLLALLLPIVGVIAFLWFAEREVIRGACPNCGQAFQVFEFALKEQPNLCPYCSQPFKLDSERQFVRGEPRFSSEKSNGFKDGFGGFGRGTSSPKDQDPGGIIVDVEAEVRDRD